MSHWPTTRMTLLERLRDPRDGEAWGEFVSVYGPLVFNFARRRLPQDEDAADVVQDVLTVVMKGSYERPRGSFQKWLVTVLLNRIRNFHTSSARRHEISGQVDLSQQLPDEPSASEQEEWDEERARQLFHIAAGRIRGRSNEIHWNVFVRTALEKQPGPTVATDLGLSITNVYAIKSRIMRELKEEIRQLEED